jgi:arylsulfatase A-like enzyme
VAKCARGSQIGGKTFKVHLDGHNLAPFFRGEAKESPRKEFLYWNDDGELVAVSAQDWKLVLEKLQKSGSGTN